MRLQGEYGPFPEGKVPVSLTGSRKKLILYGLGREEDMKAPE